MTHAIAQIRATAPANSRIYRFVGAELAVLVPESEMDDLCRAAEAIRRAVSSNAVPFEHATFRSFPITVSVGAAMYEPVSELRSATGIETPDQLVSAAMFALATGRRSRNRVIVFRRELRVES